jgi:hypothetical protein
LRREPKRELLEEDRAEDEEVEEVFRIVEGVPGGGGKT